LQEKGNTLNFTSCSCNVLYLVSQELLEIVVCFFDFIEMSEKPRYTIFYNGSPCVRTRGPINVTICFQWRENQMGKTIL